jgi:hypothetical protein
VILGVSGGAIRLAAEGPWLGDGVGVVPVGGEDTGAEVSGAVGEELGCFFFFFGGGGTKGSACPASVWPAPMLLAPVSWVSGGEVKSSSAR